MTTRCRIRSARVFTLETLLAVTLSLVVPPQASARWGGGGGFGGGRFGGGGFGGGHFGGGGFGGGQFGGGGFRGFGGDGFGGGSFGHNSFGGNSSWNHSGNSSSWQHNGQMAEQQSKYNEANTLQENHEQTEKSMHNSTMNTINNNVGQTNWNGGGGGYGPYGGCCGDGGSSTGVALGAAALGAVGGMAVGSAIANANQPTTTVVENYPEYGYQPAPYGAPALGTTVYSLPPGAIATAINGSTYFTENGVYYKPFYSGSQVVYIVSQP